MSNVNFDNLFASLTQMPLDGLLEKGLAAAGESVGIVTVAAVSEDGRVIFIGYNDVDDKNTVGIIARYLDDKLLMIVDHRVFFHLEKYIDTTGVRFDKKRFVFELEDSKLAEITDICKQIMSINRNLMDITFNKPN